VMNQQLPQRVTGRLLAERARADGGAPVPVEFSGELLYADGVSASFFCSFRAENHQWAVVSGTQGYLTVPDFVLPFFGSEAGFEVNCPVFRVRGCEHNMESHPRRFAVHEYSNGAPDSQETNMIRTFARIVTSGQLELQWGDIALKTQLVLDGCLRSGREDGRAVTVDPL
jgi:predicted dehydrogenase